MITHIAVAASLALASGFAVAGTGNHASSGKEQVRDWKKMDVDGDNHVTPKEMMDYMSAYWASQGRTAQHPAAGKTSAAPGQAQPS